MAKKKSPSRSRKPRSMALQSNTRADRELIVIAEDTVPAARVSAGRAGAARSGVARILARAGARMKPLFGLSPERLDSDREDMRAGSVRPRLELFYKVEAPASQLDALAAELAGQPRILGAYVKPAVELPRALNRMTAAPGPPPPATASFTNRQGYLGPSPAGVDAWFAWTHAGGRGEGVRVIDIEGGWRFSHEDLAQNQGGLVGGTVYDDVSWRNHGTAVMGEIGGDENPFGITGIAPAANLKAISHGGLGSAGAIRLAASILQPGDLLLLEMHRPGPRFNYASRPDQRGFIAVEWWPDDYAAIRYASGRGILVVEAAGNGFESLDDPLYDVAAPGFPASWTNPFRRVTADSGAIIVGAGAPPPGTHGNNWGPDRSRLDFSNHGECVDCQGWGRGVTTAGYGDLQGGPNEDLWYTDQFSGTSSASPIVTGALACVQGVRRAQGLPLLTPGSARHALRASGAPQQAGPNGSGRIGNRPDLRLLLSDLVTKDSKDALNKPVVNIVSYDPVLRHDGSWRAVVDDAANPGQRVIVEFVNNSLHVTWRNTAGEDRSAMLRHVEID